MAAFALKDDETTIRAHAWRVEFVEDVSELPSEAVTIMIAEPADQVAVLVPVPATKALQQSDSATVDWTLMWLPPGVNWPVTIERAAEDWVSRGGLENKETSARADVRTMRVVWNGCRALIYANPGDIRYALDAVARFSVAQRATLDLETRMKSTWGSIEADAALTHAVTLRHQKKQKHVNEMTEIATRMKMSWLRIKKCLEQLNPDLSNPSKRLFAELVAAASLFDRVDMLEEPVQFALDHYEISNTRLIETNLAREERISAIFGYGVIIALLIAQILIMWPAR